MENIVLYAHDTDLTKLYAILDAHFGKVKQTHQGNVTSLTAVVDKGFLSSGKTITFNIRQRTTPDYELTSVTDDVTNNLAGMTNLVNNIPLDDTTLKTKIIAKISTINTEIGVIAKPGFIEKFKQSIQLIATTYDTLIFSGKNTLFPNAKGQGIFNKKMELLTDFQGNSESSDIEINILSKFFEAKNKLAIPSEATPDQLNRKAIVEAILKENEIKVNENLPCLPDVANVVVRSQQAVLDRMKALLLVAIKSEGAPMSDLINFAQNFDILPHLSPAEKAYFDNENPSEQEKVNFLWRYESYFTLYWALGFAEDLHYPNGICDVQTIVGKFVELGNEGLQAAAKLRDTTTIVNQWDLAYRSHWACVDARVKGEQVSGNLMPSVVYERHYAFNWLTHYDNQDWDNVKTPT
jgi:Domain of unknown function (DUF4272)